MPVYNSENYLDETIKSVLDQSFENFEFIIVYDESKDKTLEICQTYASEDKRIKLVKNEKEKSIVGALNTGLEKSKYYYISRIDADDIYDKSKLFRQYEFMEANSDYVLVGSNAVIIDQEGSEIYTSKMPCSWKDIEHYFPNNPFFHSSVFFRKDIAIKCGGYYGMNNFAEDLILWHKMSKHGKMSNLKDPLIKYRLAPTSLTLKSRREVKILGKIHANVLKRGFLTNDEMEAVRKIKKEWTKGHNLTVYYYHIGKKHLFNNNASKLAKHNFSKAIKLNYLYFDAYVLYFISLLPKSFISFLFKIKNKV